MINFQTKYKEGMDLSIFCEHKKLTLISEASDQVVCKKCVYCVFFEKKTGSIKYIQTIINASSYFISEDAVIDSGNHFKYHTIVKGI